MADQNHIYVFATLKAIAGQEEALRKILTALVSATRQEPGNVTYHLYEGAEAPGTFLVYETYRDKAALEAHMDSPHLQAALAEASPLLGAAPIIIPATEIA